MDVFLGIVGNCWELLGDGVDFIFKHPYLLFGTGLSTVSYIIAISKRAIRVKK